MAAAGVKKPKLDNRNLEFHYKPEYTTKNEYTQLIGANCVIFESNSAPLASVLRNDVRSVPRPSPPVELGDGPAESGFEATDRPESPNLLAAAGVL